MSVNSLRPTVPRPSVDFDWSPKGSTFSFVAGGITFPYTTQADAISRPSDTRYATKTTPTNALLTFTANVVPPAGLAIIQYRWDFDDGTVAFGLTANHTYLIAIPQARVSLTVRDNIGRSFTHHRYLMLYPSQTVVLAEGTISV